MILENSEKLFESCKGAYQMFVRYRDLFVFMCEFIDYCESNNKSYCFLVQCLDNWSISLEKYIKECEK